MPVALRLKPQFGKEAALCQCLQHSVPEAAGSFFKPCAQACFALHQLMQVA